MQNELLPTLKVQLTEEDLAPEIVCNTLTLVSSLAKSGAVSKSFFYKSQLSYMVTYFQKNKMLMYCVLISCTVYGGMLAMEERINGCDFSS